MVKPIYSIIASAGRSSRYSMCYESINKGHSIPFEVVFVGNAKPILKMPANFHYIYTKVKPSQCIEIAARNSCGQYLLHVQDDLLFSDNFLTIIDQYISTNSKDKLISTRLAINGEMKDDWLFFDRKKPKKNEKRGAVSVFDRKLWSLLGGIDSRFIYSYADFDMFYRFLETGKEFLLTPDCWVNEDRTAHVLKKRITKIAGVAKGKNIMRGLWFKNGKLSKKRLCSVIPFVDKDILTKSQGDNIEGLWD